ncbi:zinc carboxypeptidase [Lacihabitans sp. LS3-19]|uniref:M14 metallopeptidase family protein n=1 Tax=Lacihabitans sp. LS3-19 TaxID=2487335 RepID=UPI0020CF848A|nr:M14 metallopeptidase family protein [Lacihabitans sp. LS3-19]MCP9770306.1 zinc carboxypeptidase [Lacihabitans sp. LS3-19]
MKKRLLFFSLFLFNFSLLAQNQYFFSGKKLNASIPSPQQFFGYEMGTHHTRYDKIIEYMRVLEAKSDRVKVVTIGETYEHREQVIVHFAKPDNLSKIEQIRESHLANAQGKVSDASMQPVVVWLGYNVHGNEASGGEASILTAYYLAASEDEEAIKWLDNAVFLMEPVINPDGRDRFANWVNMHKGNPMVADPLDREHNEVWPSGRVNHYWFDLNRDWYLAVNQETRNRLRFYHTWLPNVVTDFHEMGTNSSHFFEPTKINAQNPIVPAANYDVLNARFAKYFEKSMNEIGSFYFTKEAFDNFYPGYGNTYPDLQGGLGLLFEQGSSRGHIQDSQNGVLKFGFAVRNQLVNALATIRASVDERKYLLKYQSDFYKNIEKTNETIKGYVVSSPTDANRFSAFCDLLNVHHINAFWLDKDVSADGQTFKKDASVFIPLAQAQGLLVKSIFDRPKKFADSIFYDTSTWNLALAFGMEHAEMKTLPSQAQKITEADLKLEMPKSSYSEYAYIVDWQDYNAAKFLSYLHQKGIRVKVAMRGFSLEKNKYPSGTLMIPVSLQDISSKELYDELLNIQKETNLGFTAVSTGFSDQGIDLGSNSFKTLNAPKPIMIIGQGTSQYEAGEIWQMLDTKLNMPITKVDMANFGRVNINSYTHLVLVSGNYDELGTSTISKLKAWVKQGGTIIAMKTAIEWLIKNEFSSEKLIKLDDEKGTERVNFENIQNIAGAKTTGGAIFEVDIDNTHPMGFGFTNRKLAVYRNNNTILEPSKDRSATVAKYTAAPWLSGYVHPQVLDKIKNSASLIVENSGSGRLILFSHNPNFRGIWYGTNKLFFNSLFISNSLGQERFGSEE